MLTIEQNLKRIARLREVHGLKSRTKDNNRQAQIARTNAHINRGIL